MASDPSPVGAHPRYDFAMLSPNEIDQATDILVNAFTGEFNQRLFPGAKSDPEGYRAYTRADSFDFERDEGLRSGQQRWARVALADTGEVVAIGKWSMERPEEAQKQKEKEDSKQKWHGQDEEVCKAFFGGMTDYRLKHAQGRPHYHIGLLATKPGHRGKGAISPIIRHILAEADAAGQPVHIEATPEGLPVYLHFGWKTVDWLRMYDVDTAIMVREVPTSSS